MTVKQKAPFGLFYVKLAKEKAFLLDYFDVKLAKEKALFLDCFYVKLAGLHILWIINTGA